MESTMRDVDVFCVTGPNSKDYATLLKMSLEETSKESKLSFKCLVSPNMEAPDGWVPAGTINCDPDSNSTIWHGTGLNMIKDLSTSEYTIITDTDVMMVAEAWDAMLFSFFDDRIVIVGCENEKYRHKWHGFPCTIFMIVKTDTLKIVNFLAEFNSHGLLKVLTIRTKEEEDYYGRPVGTSIVKDTAWSMPKEYISRGYAGTVITARPVREEWASHGSDYYLDDVPILSHRGLSRGYSIAHTDTKKWINHVQRLRYPLREQLF